MLPLCGPLCPRPWHCAAQRRPTAAPTHAPASASYRRRGWAGGLGRSPRGRGRLSVRRLPLRHDGGSVNRRLVAPTPAHRNWRCDGSLIEDARAGRRQPHGGHAPTAGGGSPPAQARALRVRAADPRCRRPQAGRLDARERAPAARASCRGPGGGILGGADPFTSVRDTVRDGRFDEIIVSTLPKKTSKWLRRDLVRKIESLGLPVTTVTPTQQSLRAAVEDSDDVSRGLVLGGGGGA
jgi:hypothetical protein